MDRLRGTVPLSSWDAARAKAGGTYDADLVNRFRVERSAGRIPDGASLQANVLGLVAPLLGKPDMMVTDLGGATGDLGADFLKVWPAAHYTVVENPTMAALMQGRGAVRFTTEIPPACDIFFTSSTLHYLDDPMAALARGLASASRAAIVVRNGFADDEKFYAQRSRLYDNGGGPVPPGYADRWISYPRRTIREAEILALAQAQGFQCIARLDESCAYRRAYSRQLVMWRTEAAPWPPNLAPAR